MLYAAGLFWRYRAELIQWMDLNRPEEQSSAMPGEETTSAVKKLKKTIFSPKNDVS